MRKRNTYPHRAVSTYRPRLHHILRKDLQRYNPINISGYHISEAGSSLCTRLHSALRI